MMNIDSGRDAFILKSQKPLVYDDTKQEDVSFGTIIHQIRKPKLKDKEFIAIDLTSEYMGIDSKCQLFRDLPVF